MTKAEIELKMQEVTLKIMRLTMDPSKKRGEEHLTLRSELHALNSALQEKGGKKKEDFSIEEAQDAIKLGKQKRKDKKLAKNK